MTVHDGCDLAVLACRECQPGFFDVDIRQSVAIAQQKCLFVNALRGRAALRPPVMGIQTSFGQCHLEPLFRVGSLVMDTRVTTQADREIVIHRLVIQKIFA